MSYGNRLQMLHNLSADLLTISNCVPSLYSCNLCSWPLVNTLRLFAVSALNNHCWKCGGPCLRVVRWMKPSITMSRRSDNRAKLKTDSSVIASMPTSSRKLSCTRLTCCSKDVQAWYMVAMRYSQYDNKLALYKWS